VSAPDSYLAACAAVGARLRGDREGEQAVTDDCCAHCRPLVNGLVDFAAKALRAVARIDQAPPTVAADAIDTYLQAISGPGRRNGA
jgi:hypothetical protein